MSFETKFVLFMTGVLLVSGLALIYVLRKHRDEVRAQRKEEDRNA